jgi:hypothetical protein
MSASQMFERNVLPLFSRIVQTFETSETTHPTTTITTTPDVTQDSDRHKLSCRKLKTHATVILTHKNLTNVKVFFYSTFLKFRKSIAFVGVSVILVWNASSMGNCCRNALLFKHLDTLIFEEDFTRWSLNVDHQLSTDAASYSRRVETANTAAKV